MQKNSTDTIRVALITGAAKRIGADIAETLHEAGMNIVLHYHTSEHEASSLCDKLNKKRPNSAAILQADLMNIPHLKKLAHQAAEQWGHLDVLVNNAARFYRTPIHDVTESQWDELMTANLKAAFFLAQAAAPYLAKRQGCIVNIADVHGERPMQDYAVYCISKAGLLMMTKSLAKELGPDVRVNAVSPTMISPEGKNAVSDAVKKKVIERIALGRLGEGKDIAKAVLFLVASAEYVTGQVIAVDGGRSLSI